MEIDKSVGMELVGYVVANQFIPKNGPVIDYCCTILSNGVSFESWTLRSKRECTYICRNAEPLGKCYSKWEDHLLGPCRISWELYLGDTHFGIVRRGSYLFFGKWFYSKNMVTRNSLGIQREGKRALPIHIDRNDTLLAFFKCILRVATLAPLWMPKNLFVNNDRCIPTDAPALEDEAATAFYFMVNVVFRGVFFDLYFSPKAGV
jgi:hypothetical protein